VSEPPFESVVRTPSPSRFRRAVTADGGFTMVEVLVAATLLVIGALATLALLDNGARATTQSRQRDVANALAQEMVERATGGRNVLTVDASGNVTGRNDMTDIDKTAPLAVVGPADRLRTAMDRSAPQPSTAVTPATPTSGQAPVNAPQSWQLTRNGTTFTVSYRACTSSDAYQVQPGQLLTILGPYDCSRATYDLGTSPTTPVIPVGGGTATCNLLGVNLSPSGTSAGSGSTDPISIGIQLLGLVGVDACLGPNLQPLTTGLCQVVGGGGIVSTLLQNVAGASGLLGQLKVGAVNASLCDATQIAPGLASAIRLTASATRIAVTVAWTDHNGVAQTISRTTVVRRPTT
jgi:type IV pilus modification protein PilV